MALGPGTGRLLSGSVVRGFRADGRGQGPAVSASSGTLPFAVMPGLVPLLSGLEFRHGFRAHGRAHLRAPCCHPGLVPGSRTPRKPGQSSRICVYGGAGPRNKSGVTIGTGAPCAGVPQCVSRVERSAGNPLVPRPHSQPMKVKPDSSGLVPGIHVPPPPRPLRARTPIPQRKAANETLLVELGVCGQGLHSRPVGRRGERWGRHAREPGTLRQAASRPRGPNRYRTVACLPAAGVGSGGAVFIQDPGHPRCAAEAFGANGRSPCDSPVCRKPMKRLVPDDGLEPPTC